MTENLSAKKLSILSGLLFASALLAVGVDSFLPSSAHSGNGMASVIGATDLEIHAPPNPFLNIALEAHAVYVLDLKTGTVLYAKNENEKLPLASVTKLMTALLAREHMSESTVVTLTKDDLAAEGDSGLRPGERWRIEELLNVMLLVSSNDAAHAVAEFVGSQGHAEVDPVSARNNFIKMMNERAVALGFSTMEFFNESGLDVNDAKTGLPVQAGGYGSAREVALLMGNLLNKYPDTLEITALKDARIFSQDNITHILPNTNEVIGHIPGLVASKTGYTILAGGNLAVIFDRGIGDPVVAVVLGSSYKGRFDDMQKLVATALKTENSEK